jgi:hypothetical protein
MQIAPTDLICRTGGDGYGVGDKALPPVSLLLQMNFSQAFYMRS